MQCYNMMKHCLTVLHWFQRGAAWKRVTQPSRSKWRISQVPSKHWADCQCRTAHSCCSSEPGSQAGPLPSPGTGVQRRPAAWDWARKPIGARRRAGTPWHRTQPGFRRWGTIASRGKKRKRIAVPPHFMHDATEQATTCHLEFTLNWAERYADELAALVRNKGIVSLW